MPRPFRMPIGLAFFGLAGVSAIFLAVVATHRIARLAGPAWMIAAVIYYFVFRARAKLPVGGSVKRDWEKEQLEALQAADEPELVDEYQKALRKK
jgi:hypothetical protein